MDLNSFEKRFLEQIKPRLLVEIECLKGLDTIQYPDTQNEELLKYRRKFLLDAFVTMAGELFFLSHSVHEPIADEFIRFCKQYQGINEYY